MYRLSHATFVDHRVVQRMQEITPTTLKLHGQYAEALY